MDYKKYIKTYIQIILLLFYSNFVTNSQEEIRNQIIEDYIEDLASYSENEPDFGMIYEDLQFYLEQPLNINTASEEELRKLYILNDFQISSLLKYRDTHGAFLTLYELQLVYGFDMELAGKLSPFITIGPSAPADIKMVKYGHHQFMVRYSQILEEQEGYHKTIDSLENISSFQGSPVKIYTRYSYRYKDKIFWGFTAEKDAGEEFFQGSNPYGFDFYSFHVIVKNTGIIKTIALGDYHLGFGQGLVVNTGFSMGKTPDVLNLRKYDRGITKYSSTDENQFMRGIATTIVRKNWELTGFYSRKKIDANLIENDSLDDKTLFSSFPNTGLHATLNEIEDEDALVQQVAGGNVSYNKKITGWD